MGKYLRRKVLIYLLTFFIAVSIDWMIPRFMPGDPLSKMLVGITDPETYKSMKKYITTSFGLDKPIIIQYFNFWKSFLSGDLGLSISQNRAPVTKVIMNCIPYSLGVMLPAIILSWIIGNWFGAFAAKRKGLDNYALPVMYILTATPYLWFGIISAYFLGVVLNIFPYNGAYSPSMTPGFSIEFIFDYLSHWVLPFLSLFVVMLGGWAIGMRNMIIYELEANYSRYLETLGAPNKLIRKYAFRNAVLPQVTGLGLQLGVIVAGNLTTEIVFSYPGVGYYLLKAILNADYFLIQGFFIFIIIGVLLANFLIDIIYIFIDPRVRYAFGGKE